MFFPSFTRRSWLPTRAIAAWLLAVALTAATLTIGATAGVAAAPPVAAPPVAAPPVAAPPVAASSAAPAPSAVWSTAHPATSPPPLAYAAAAYDGDDHTVVLYGGELSNGALSSDTWVWDGTNWTDFPNSQPGGREMASMAFEPAQHQLILFGGQGANGALLSDTWAWNGQQWSQLDSAGAAPSPRDGAAFAYDPSGNLVLFGGTGQAAPAIAPGSVPSAAGSTLVDPPATETVLGDTWQWNGSGWIPGPATGPPSRTGAQMAFDSARGATVLFSGQSTPPGSGAPALIPDTWTWNGTAWSPQPAANAPPARSGAVFDDDPALGGPLLVGGAGAGGALGDGWMWNGRGWVQAQVAGSPTPLAGAAGGFNRDSSAFMLFGGLGADGSTLSSTELVTSAGGTPAPQPTPHDPKVPPTTTAPTTAGKPHGSRSPTSSKTTPTTRHRSPSQTTVGPTSGQPRSMKLLASVHNVRQGASVELTGSGFEPGSLITITFHSAPAFLGSTVADGAGTFTASVDVPRSAHPGQHHFEAQGVARSGQPADLVTAVFVLGPIGSHGPTAFQTAVMLALALLIPAGAWVGMTGFGWWRRRQPNAAK